MAEVSTTPGMQDRVEELVAVLRERWPQAPPEAETFFRRFCASLDPEDLAEAAAPELVGAAEALWRLGERRRPGEALVRVYDPDPETDGWRSRHTVVDVVNDDMPFLLASVAGELGRRERRIHRVAHPVVETVRDAEDRRRPDADASGRRESFLHFEIDRELLGGEGRREIAGDLAEVLEEVRAAVEDWVPMQEEVRRILGELEEGPPVVDAEERQEAGAFLGWLLDDHFTFLGYRRYRIEEGGDGTRLVPEASSGLGVLRRLSEEARRRGERRLTPELLAYLERRELLMISKSGRRARVHRPVHMDSIGVRRFDAAGRMVGEDRFLGLLTSTAYAASAKRVPLLRRKVRRTIERAGFVPASHDAKLLIHILETFPREELLQIDEEELFEMALSILRLQLHQRVALLVRCDELERFVSCLVYVPRDRYSSELRERMRALLEESFAGRVSAFATQLGEAPLARTYFRVRTSPEVVAKVDVKALEARLADEARSWSDRLRVRLLEAHDEVRGLSLLARYRDAFPGEYRERSTGRLAVDDIARVEALLASGEELGIHFFQPPGLPPSRVRLKLLSRSQRRSLSAVLPVLENLGMRVESGVPFEVRPHDADPVWIHDFDLRSADGSPLPVAEVGGALAETVRRVFRGELENGVLNQVVLAARLDWRESLVLRAYSRYLRQIGITFSQRYMARTLVRHPEVTRRLVELFHAHFDPERRDGARSRAAAVLGEIRRELEGIDSLDEDRILRAFLSVVQATLRTNYYRRTADGESPRYLSFKLDGRAIRGLPEPRPQYEVFVYSPRVEGVHLRGGKVARGGIRWSDRLEDYRTEVLGLVKAQMVKNAVIVPVGAKGGFVVKRPPKGGDREALVAEGQRCYQTFIRGLLDLTDNLAGDGSVVPPERVVRRDDGDPYLVVAADKGTATFSDLANRVAADYGFWLGDAFASGGSAGYDHKKMAITARGAWEAVKRHFRELGKDIQSEDFTVVGIGDMGGDVFGNGMLLSRHIRLVGAFDHRHVFVDPDPDPEVSFAQRRRLFELPRSSWVDYDPAVLSSGGMVFERSAKVVALTPEVQRLLGVERGRMTPPELIRALLTLRVDLLWFGGIGTFVKAASERHGDVGDRTNDGVRVDATELRCRVVGEGANLGMTQAARIEYALGGGRVNTDAIDNSGGVDVSDHEVNLKIAFREAVAAGEIDVASRNALLEEMSGEVAELVLRDNYLQTQALTLAESQSHSLVDQQERMMHRLEREGRLDRELEGLPGSEELEERRSSGRGLTRPELAVLLAYAKIDLYAELLASELPDEPLLEDDLLLYFPEVMGKRFRPHLVRHRLRREIIATWVTNSTVNRVGPTFVDRLRELSGRAPEEVARAYAVTRDAFQFRHLWSAVEALDNRVPAALQTEMLLEAGRLVEHATLWFLRRFPEKVEVSATVVAYRPGLERLTAALPSLLPERAAAEHRRRREELEGEGVPEELATAVAALPRLAAGCDLVVLAGETGRPVEAVGRAYFEVGERLGLEWLREAAETVREGSPWHREAVEVLVERFFQHQSRLARAALAGEGSDWREAVERWWGSQPTARDQVLELVAELREAGRLELAMLPVAEHRLGRLR